MCINYRPTDAEILEAMTGLSPAGLPPWKAEVWQDYAAPIVRAGEANKPELVLATYGMVPKRRAPPGVALSTMNARAETIGQKRSFAVAWRNSQTCLVPTHSFYEPNWETGRAQR
jgi:putative SOS response-associated peptidase YedK